MDSIKVVEVLSRERLHLDWKLLVWTGTGSVSSEMGGLEVEAYRLDWKWKWKHVALEVEVCCLDCK